MLAEERFAAILQLLQEKKTVTVNELTKTLHISESTIRRDLVSLHKMKNYVRSMEEQPYYKRSMHR